MVSGNENVVFFPVKGLLNTIYSIHVKVLCSRFSEIREGEKAKMNIFEGLPFFLVSF